MQRKAPPPLTPEQQQLVADNLGLARKAAWDLRRMAAKVQMPMDDTISEGYIGLCAAARTYDPAKGEYGGYGYYAARCYILRAFQKYGLIRPPTHSNQYYEQPRYVSLDAPTHEREDGYKRIINLEMPAEDIDGEIDLKAILDSLTPKKREIVEMRMQGASYRIIAEKHGVCHEAIRQQLGRIRMKLEKEALVWKAAGQK